MNKIEHNQKIEREFHDKWAQETDLDAIRPEIYFESYSAFENRFALESFGDIRGKKILDLGCGNGEAAVYFAKQGAFATAVDISPACVGNALTLAQKHGVSIESGVMEAEHLRFNDGVFDHVFGLGALHHFADLDQCMKEIARVLKPGGSAAFIEPLSHNPAIAVYRVLAKEVRTPTEAPLSWDRLMGLKDYFSSLEHREFWFFSLLIFFKFFFLEWVNPSKVRYWKKVLDEAAKYEASLKKLRSWDERFLNRFPYFKRHCWNTVLILKK